MLTCEDALLILDHVVEIEIFIDDIDGQDATEWDQTVDAELYGRIRICGKVFSIDRRIEVSNDRCPFSEIYGDVDHVLDGAICRVRRDFARMISEDAGTSNHRALEYMPLLNQARDRAARLDEIPAHVIEEVAA